MLRNRRLAFGIVCASIVVASAGAQTPSLSGTWKLNLAKSNYGTEPPPKSLTVTITIQEPKIRMAVDGISSNDKEQKFEMELTTDGKPVINEKNDTSDSAQWDGATLMLEHNRQNYTLTRRITLSDDGKTVTSKNVFKVNSGRDLVVTEVYDRQP
jgi:hypothetical protein